MSLACLFQKSFKTIIDIKTPIDTDQFQPFLKVCSELRPHGMIEIEFKDF